MERLLTLDQQATLAINGSQSIFWDNVMLTVTNTFAWTLLIACLIYILFKNNTFRSFIAILLTIAIMIAVMDRLCSGLVKPLVARWRPTQDPNIMYLVDTVNNYRGGRFGFFSGHASNTFCVATFLALLFRYTPMSIALYFWAITTTYTRLYLGVHYLGDVLVGAVAGASIGTITYIIYYLIQRKVNKTPKLISQQFTASGYLKTHLNAFLAVIAFNYILVITIAMLRGIG